LIKGGKIMGATVVKETQEKMEKTIESTKAKFAAIRAGRANVSMLDGVMVNSYGSPTPLKQIGQISAPEARLLTIDPWDKSLIKEVEKGIQQANLGFNPSNDGKIIRILIPELTQDRRKEYLKIVKKEAEDGKVAIRNIRKDMNNKLRKLEKDGDISEDELKVFETKIQDITDKFIKEVDELYAKKEKELTTV
jgi:ribosome recycling factor